jgi:hypothetical protein
MTIQFLQEPLIRMHFIVRVHREWDPQRDPVQDYIWGTHLSCQYSTQAALEVLLLKGQELS